jgi:ABC-type antimicrobial peptide transport system permease subunit
VGAVRFAIGRILRRRWRRVLVLALLTGAIGAAAIAPAAGARRSASSLDRFRAWSRAADGEISTFGVPSRAQLSAFRRAGSLTDVTGFVAFGLQVPAVPGLQDIGAPLGGDVGAPLDRGRLVRGRLANPASADEVAIGEALAAQLHLGVGGTLDAESFTPAQIDAIEHGAADVGPMAGPSVRLRVVGIVRRPVDLSERAVAGGFLVLSPAFGNTYGGRVGVFGTRLRFRTRSGAAGVPAAITAAHAVFGDAVLSANGLTDETAGASDAVHVVSVTLWVLAGVVALSGLVALGVIVSREVALSRREDSTLRALGAAPSARRAVYTSPAVAAALIGVPVAALGAMAASPLFPTGLARRADPDVGFHADWLVLLLGAACLGAALVGIAVATAFRVTRPAPTSSAAAMDARGTAPLVARVVTSLPTTVGRGVATALGLGGERRPVVVQSAFAGAAVAVLGVVSVLAFRSSLDHLASTPRLFGTTWDVAVQDTTANTPCGGGDYGASQVPGLTGLAEVCYQSVRLDGRPVEAIAFTTIRGTAIDPEVIAGRAPQGEHEVALASATLDALRKRLGDTVVVAGRSTQQEYEIVGRVVMPTLGQAQPPGDGAAFSGAGFAPLFDQNLFSRYFVGRIAAGSDAGAVSRRLDAIPQLGSPSAAIRPAEIEHLRQVDWAPAVLAALLAALGGLTVGHALIVTVRQRRREFAVLKALGFDRRQVASTVVWQATTIAVIGLAIGMPLGIVVAKFAWRAIATSLGVAPFVAIPTPALALTVFVATTLAVLTAAAPASLAARTSVAAALRTE